MQSTDTSFLFFRFCSPLDRTDRSLGSDQTCRIGPESNLIQTLVVVSISGLDRDRIRHDSAQHRDSGYTVEPAFETL